MKREKRKNPTRKPRVWGTHEPATRLDEQFFAAVDAANNRVAEIEGSVRRRYLVGTALLLLSTIVVSVLLELTLRRLEKKDADADAPEARQENVAQPAVTDSSPSAIGRPSSAVTCDLGFSFEGPTATCK